MVLHAVHIAKQQRPVAVFSVAVAQHGNMAGIIGLAVDGGNRIGVVENVRQEPVILMVTPVSGLIEGFPVLLLRAAVSGLGGAGGVGAEQRPKGRLTAALAMLVQKV